MLAIIGMVVVVGAVLGGYAIPGGHLAVLWQPFEFVIIFGAGIGAFLITNPSQVVGGTLKAFGTVIKRGPNTTKRPTWSSLACFIRFSS